MATKIHARIAFTTGASIGWSIERLSDGKLLDFNDGTFKSSAWTTKIQAIAEGTGDFVASYSKDFVTSAAQFTDGRYTITYHNTASANAVILRESLQMRGADDMADVWQSLVPGSYPSGSAGLILGNVATGVVLTSAGLDAVVIEAGLNARQAIQLDTAVLAGVIAGAGTGTVTAKGAGIATTRVTAAVDGVGNRSALTLNPT
jgi:hypothetical protein